MYSVKGKMFLLLLSTNKFVIICSAQMSELRIKSLLISFLTNNYWKSLSIIINKFQPDCYIAYSQHRN